MPGIFKIIFLLFLFVSLCSCFKPRNYTSHNGNPRPLPSYRSSLYGKNYLKKNRLYKSLNTQRRGFSRAPSGPKYNPSYGRALKKEQNGFSPRGITHGRPNALAMNRHTQSSFRKTFPFLFPGKPKYYRGRRSKLGLFHLK